MKEISEPQLAAAGMLLLEDPLKGRHGLAFSANATRMASAYFNEPLTQYGIGWTDQSPVQAELDFLAPPVQTGRKFSFRKAANAQYLLTESDDVRAIGADYKRIQFSGEMQESSTQNKGLTVYVDLDEVQDMPNWEQQYTAWLLARLNRNDLIRAHSAVAAALAAASTVTTKTWGSNSDPDTDLLDLVDVGGDDSGMDPNRVFIGKRAWLRRVKAFRAQDNAGAYDSSKMSEADLAAMLGVDAVRRGMSRYQSSASGKSKVAGDVVYAFFAEDGQMPIDASNVKRFWSNEVDGGRVRIYRQEVGPKLVAITASHNSRIVVVSTPGLRGYNVQ